MKKFLDIMVQKPWIVLIYALVLIGLRVVVEINGDGVLPEPSPVVKTTFLIVVGFATLYVLSLFIIALFSKKQSRRWWEKKDAPERELLKERIAGYYMKGFLIALPISIYGIVTYMALFQDWKNMIFMAIVFACSLLLNRYRSARASNAE